MGFIIALKNYKNAGEVIRGSQNVSLQPIEELDTDQDGLKDWEEELLGSDPKNKDTDGDGIQDGKEEIFKKTADILPIFQKNEVTTVSAPNLTKTDEITQGLFINYLSLKQGGGINTGSINELVKDFEQQIFSPSLGVTLYSKNDLTLVSDNNALLLTYANAVNSLFTKYREPLLINLSQKSTEDISSPEYTVAVLLISETYKTVAKNLIKIPVPMSLAGSHVALANNFLRSGELLKGISASESDYLLMLSSVKELETTRAEEYNLLKTLDSYLTSRGIIFEETTNTYSIKQ